MTAAGGVHAAPGRIAALDALRGLAALCVFFTHTYSTWPGQSVDDFINFFPFYVFINHNAPIVFFVLSGYVMALPFFGPRPLGWLPFAAKRAARLYVPFAAATLVSTVLFYASSITPLYFTWTPWSTMPAESLISTINHTPLTPWPWLNDFLMLGRPGIAHAPLTWKSIYEQLALTGVTSMQTLNTVVWALVHEVRISLIFPLLIPLCRSTPRALLAGAAMFVIGTAGIVASGQSNMWLCETENAFVSWLITLRFIPFFIAGILLVRHREQIGALIAHMPRWGVAALWVAVIWVMCLPTYHVLDILFGAAVATIVALCSFSPWTQRVFMATPLPRLGRVAYGFYLLHLPVLFVLTSKLSTALPYWGICVAIFIVSFALATLLYHLTEVPSKKLGYWAAARFARHG
ncbi:MAG: acyltransferase family protein [Alphaproteobacteria bacterium]|nr:acyltransferase family protein [Alphaproteobacteria bacterium]